MTAISVPRHRSLLGALVAAAPGVRRMAVRVLPLIREHVVTVAAFTAVDYGAFGFGARIGWIVTGVTALLLDYTVRG